MKELERVAALAVAVAQELAAEQEPGQVLILEAAQVRLEHLERELRVADALGRLGAAKAAP
jgi:hypothetical protein